MNATERMHNTFAGRAVDRLANQPIVMTFAGRWAGIPYGEYVRDHRKLVEAQLRMVEDFEIDLMQVISDPAREAADCGATIKWFDDQPPAIDEENALLKEKTSLLKLRQPDPLGGGRMHDRVLGCALAREKVGDSVPVCGWVEGPIAEAADLRGINRIMLDLIDDPPFVLDLFAFIVEMEINFARAQIEAGADIIGIGDAAASLISDEFYREYVFPFEKREIEAIHEMGAYVRLHICGNVTHHLRTMGELGVDMVDIDCLTDLSLVRPNMGAEVTVLGNADPVEVVQNGTPESVYRALEECHRTIGDSRFIVGAGCEIPPGTPPENLRAFAEYARNATLT
jgi:MtaA/CmuA family methyltransferase